MSHLPFKFKQFTIHQDRCAMKIGTDGVLLGAWGAIDHEPDSILDIGAGTGVVALMMAQRSKAHVIDALEIDDAAYEQSTENFENSRWSDRLFCYHASLQEFAEEIDDRYDLITCNPPFYSEDYKSKNESRDIARFQDAMPFDHLVACASKLLSTEGKFVTILPFKEESQFIELASKADLHVNNILRVRGNASNGLKRSLMEFSFYENDKVIKELTIETGRHEYTKDYIDLTNEFYLKM